MFPNSISSVCALIHRAWGVRCTGLGFKFTPSLRSLSFALSDVSLSFRSSWAIGNLKFDFT